MARVPPGARLSSASRERRSHAHLDRWLGLVLDDLDDGLLARRPRRGHLHRGAACATAADEAEGRLMNAPATPSREPSSRAANRLPLMGLVLSAARRAAGVGRRQPRLLARTPPRARAAAG